MFWQSSFIYTLSRSVSLLTPALNYQTIVAGARHTVISQYFLSYATCYGLYVDPKRLDFDVFSDINGKLRQKDKDVT